MIRMKRKMKVLFILSCCLFTIGTQYGYAQKGKEIKGTITDENGERMPGVNILEKGTLNGTSSDMEGVFHLTLTKDNSSLELSFLGYKNQDVAVGTRTEFPISMESESTSLDQVVVLGYTNSRKQDLSVAVSTMKVDEGSTGRPTSLATLLQGQVTGVTVTQSGDPTASSKISIRGKGNKDGDAVLYVVDGVPGAPFNAADIETITILKDAASAAIYGAHAGSGGVIVITTKQAKEGKISVKANAWLGLQEAWKLPKVLTAEEFNRVWKQASDDAVQDKNKVVPAAYDPQRFPYGNVTRTDWIDEIFRVGKLQHYDLTLSGGSKELKALASISYDNVEGTLINTYSQNLTTRLNVDFALNKWVSLRQKLTYEYGNGKSDIGSGHTGTVFTAMAYPRYATVYEQNEDGSFVDGMYGGTLPRWALDKGFSVEADLRNPVATLEKIRQYNPSHRIFSNTSLEIKPISSLSLKSDYSHDVIIDRNESFEKKFLEPGKTVDQNFRTISNTLQKNWIWENIISYSKTFDLKHYVSLLGGFTASKKSQRYNLTKMRGFVAEDEHSTVFPSGTVWSDKPDEDIWTETSVSVLGRVAYSYDDRYFLNASIRRDASSKLNPDDNYDVFPSFSAAWKITSEEFIPKNEILSFMKLRASWGQVGNINSVRRFIYAPPYQITGWPVFLGENGDTQGYGMLQGTIANPKLKWERTEQTNIGLDLGLFKNSLNLTFDYFNKRTKDLIEERPLPSVAGVASPPEYNVGEVTNKGWELNATYTKQIGQVELNLGGNISVFKNEVINLGAKDFIAHDDRVNSIYPLQSTAGRPWHSFYLIESMGIFRSQEEINNYTWTDSKSGKTQLIQPKAQVGDLKFRDANNDGKINNDDRTYQGAYDMPDFSYGFNLGLKWKNLSVHMIFQGVAGVKIFNGIKAMTYTGSKGWNMSRDVLDSYNFNPNSDIPRLAVREDDNGNYTNASNFFLESGNYLRMKNLNISYTLSKNLIKTIGLGECGLRVYFNAENLLTITNYKGFDPEVGNLGIDAGRYPVARILSAGINVSF